MSYFRKPNPNNIRIVSLTRLQKLGKIQYLHETPTLWSKTKCMNLGRYSYHADPGVTEETYRAKFMAYIATDNVLRMDIAACLIHLSKEPDNMVRLLVDDWHPSDNVVARVWKSFLITGGDTFG